MDKIQYKAGYKYQIVNDYKVDVGILPIVDVFTDYISLSKKGVLTVLKGYSFDGPSGITVDTKTFMRGALIHDSTYQLIRMGHLPPMSRLKADANLRMHCLEDGMWKVRAWYVYWAVRWFGGSAADPSNKKQIIIAPS